MGRRASTVQEWFSLNQEELIQCPYQLGNLKITKSSCLQQRRRSDDWVYGTTPDNYILFAFEMHLKVCRDCDQVKSVALGQAADSRLKGRRFQKMGRSPGGQYRTGLLDSKAVAGGAKKKEGRSVGNNHHSRKQHQAGL